MIITFYNEKVDNDIVLYQKKVFEHFGQTIHQIKPDVWRGHGGSIDYFIENHKKRWEYLILFDIDCIPLDNSIIPESIDWIKNNNGLFSIAQKASHIKDSIIYAGPAFISFTKKTYDLMNRPTFTCTDRSDCAGELTHKANEMGLPVNLLYPTDVSVPRWDLNNEIKFGTGTNFENRIYHHFESRKNIKDGFVKKCIEVIGKNG